MSLKVQHCVLCMNGPNGKSYLSLSGWSRKHSLRSWYLSWVLHEEKVPAKMGREVEGKVSWEKTPESSTSRGWDMAWSRNLKKLSLLADCDWEGLCPGLPKPDEGFGVSSTHNGNLVDLGLTEVNKAASLRFLLPRSARGQYLALCS